MRLDRINIGEELGDRFWYHALISAAVGDGANIEPHANLEKGLQGAVKEDHLARLIMDVVMADSKLGDTDKRLMQYGKKPTAEVAGERHLASVKATVAIAGAMGFAPLVIMQANIAKLYRRMLNALLIETSMGDLTGRDLAAEKAILAAALS